MTSVRALVSVLYAVGTVVLLEARPQGVVSFTSTNSTLDVHYDEHSAKIQVNGSLPPNSSRDRTRILTHPFSHRKVDNDQDIVFPDSFEEEDQAVVGHLDGPPNCAGGATFCEEIESYPYGRLKDVLRKTKAHNDLFGLDESSDEIANRIGEPVETFICGSVEKIIYPKVGKTKYNQWKYIINQGDDEGYVQGVRVETCKRLNRPCDLIGSIPDGYTTSCKQKYVYRRMLSISDIGQPVADTFLMPSACCCSYTRDTQFLTDFRRDVTRTKR